MRYPNKNVGPWDHYDGPPESDEPYPDIQCTAETPQGGGMNTPIRWIQCKMFVPDWDGDNEPLCEEHSEAALMSEVADMQLKAMKENDDG